MWSDRRHRCGLRPHASRHQQGAAEPLAGSFQLGNLACQFLPACADPRAESRLRSERNMRASGIEVAPRDGLRLCSGREAAVIVGDDGYYRVNYEMTLG